MRRFILDSFGLRQGPLAGSCKHCNELSESTHGGEYFDKLSDYQLLKHDNAPWIYLFDK
jgi:hypothetical protein